MWRAAAASGPRLPLRRRARLRPGPRGVRQPAPGAAEAVQGPGRQQGDAAGAPPLPGRRPLRAPGRQPRGAGRPAPARGGGGPPGPGRRLWRGLLPAPPARCAGPRRAGPGDPVRAGHLQARRPDGGGAGPGRGLRGGRDLPHAGRAEPGRRAAGALLTGQRGGFPPGGAPGRRGAGGQIGTGSTRWPGPTACRSCRAGSTCCWRTSHRSARRISAGWCARAAWCWWSDRNGVYAVAGTYRMPVVPSRVDVLLAHFSPVSAEDFRRVVRPGGVVLVGGPGAEHLYGLKQLVYAEPERHEPQDPLAVRGEGRVADLLVMTPFYWSVPDAVRERLARLEQLDTEVDVVVHAYRRTRDDGTDGTEP